jgi:hypothetical protein
MSKLGNPCKWLYSEKIDAALFGGTCLVSEDDKINDEAFLPKDQQLIGPDP